MVWNNFGGEEMKLDKCVSNKQKSILKTSTFVQETTIFSNPTKSIHTLGKQSTTIECPDTSPTPSMTYLEMYHVASIFLSCQKS